MSGHMRGVSTRLLRAEAQATPAPSHVENLDTAHSHPAPHSALTMNTAVLLRVTGCFSAVSASFLGLSNPPGLASALATSCPLLPGAVTSPAWEGRGRNEHRGPWQRGTSRTSRWVPGGSQPPQRHPFRGVCQRGRPRAVSSVVRQYNQSITGQGLPRLSPSAFRHQTRLLSSWVSRQPVGGSGSRRGPGTQSPSLLF